MNLCKEQKRSNFERKTALKNGNYLIGFKYEQTNKQIYPIKSLKTISYRFR